MPDLVRLLVDFSRELRAAGLAVGTGDVQAYCGSLAALDPTDLVDLYWSGRITLVTRRDDLVVYDEVFRRFFLGASSPPVDLLALKATPAGAVAARIAARARNCRRLVGSGIWGLPVAFTPCRW